MVNVERLGLFQQVAKNLDSKLGGKFWKWRDIV